MASSLVESRYIPLLSCSRLRMRSVTRGATTGPSPFVGCSSSDNINVCIPRDRSESYTCMNVPRPYPRDVQAPVWLRALQRRQLVHAPQPLAAPACSVPIITQRRQTRGRRERERERDGTRVTMSWKSCVHAEGGGPGVHATVQSQRRT